MMVPKVSHVVTQAGIHLAHDIGIDNLLATHAQV